MDTLRYKTISANKETAKKEWVVVDATDQVVGRLCSKVAKLLRGKYKPNFTPHADCGDNVIIINSEKVVFTGKKETDKVYTRYTGYPGGQRFNTPSGPFGSMPLTAWRSILSIPLARLRSSSGVLKRWPPG